MTKDIKNLFRSRRFYLTLATALLLLVFFSGGAAGGYYYFKKTSPQVLSSAVAQDDTHLEFISEIYDKIKENYWEKVSDDQLVNLFKLGAEKLTGSPLSLKKSDRENFRGMINQVNKGFDAKQKKEFAVNLANIVLNNLKPFGRSGLYSSKEEKNLSNRVQNINPERNLYNDLGVGQAASESAIRSAYENLLAKLTPFQKDPEIGKKLENAKYAYDILTKPRAKETYDKAGAEPTVSARLLSPSVAYLGIKQISPTTFEEFQNEVNNLKGGDNLNSLIVDLRGNIGGSIDVMPYFLGPFLGIDRYAYEFFHQGESTPFKTKTGYLESLYRYKKVVVLIDGEVQSSGEVLAAALKKYNVGILVGTPTKGWGTVERIFQIDRQIDPAEKYSVFLVHSLTLREDNQPIEGKGVDPVININDSNWEKELNKYFNYPELTQSVKDLVKP